VSNEEVICRECGRHKNVMRPLNAAVMTATIISSRKFSGLDKKRKSAAFLKATLGICSFYTKLSLRSARRVKMI